MHASEVITKDEMVLLNNWFDMDRDKKRMCRFFADLRTRIPKCDEYNGIKVYRGVGFNFANIETRRIQNFFTRGFTPIAPCDSWTTDRNTAIFIAKRGSQLRTWLDPDSVNLEPEQDIGFTFERKVTSKDCLLPIPALFDLDWSGLGIFMQMIKEEQKYDEEEFVMRSTLLSMKNITHMYIYSHTGNNFNEIVFAQLRKFLPLPEDVKKRFEETKSEDNWEEDVWIDVDFKKKAVYWNSYNDSERYSL